MSRTTPDLVQAVLDAGQAYDPTKPLQPFIDAATVIVDRVAACALKKNKALLDTELEIIERWLSAHVYVMSDQAYSSKSTSGASASFQGQTQMYLEASKYGQMAMMIDSSVCLINLSKSQLASGFWMGKHPS